MSVRIGAFVLIGLALFVQISSQQPLSSSGNNNNDFISASNEAQELLKIQQQQEVQNSRHSPYPGNQVMNFPNNAMESLMKSTDDLKKLKLSRMYAIHDENRRYGTVSIKFPVRAMNMLDQLRKDISWSLFQELYQ